MKKYKLKKDLPMLEAGNEVILELKKINDKKVGFYYDIKSTNTNRVFDSFCVISKSKINEWLEEVIEKPKNIWDLKVGDFYFCILESGEVERFDILDEILFETYKKDLEIGNVFITEEEAEKELEKRKAIQKIKKYCWENGIDNEFNQSKYNDISFYMTKEGNISHGYQCKNGNPIGCFNFENTKKILEKFEDELKIILDV